MPRDAAFIQLESGEDANSLRDRLQFYRGQAVLIVWPEEGTALNRKLDLVLVQREAMRRAIRLALVTHDAQVIEHARDLDISTFETIGASERGRWKRGRTKVFANRDQKPKGEAEPEELMPVASRVRAPVRVPMPSILRLFIVGLVIAVLLGVAYIALPGATVTVTLAKRDVVGDAMITASPAIQQINVEGARIPARYILVEVEQTGTYPASGRLDGEDTRSTGTVTIVNRTDNAISIPSGTMVSTADAEPVRFRLLDDAQLAGGQNQSVEVRVEALPEFSGEIANVGAARITAIEGDFADSVTVTNLLPLSGGQNRTLPVVTDSDRTRLRAALLQQIQAQAQLELDQLLGDGEFYIDESISITPESDRADWQVYSADAGEIAAEVSLELRAVVQAMVVNQRDAERIAFAALSRNIPRGRSLDISTLSYERGPIESISENGEVTFRMFADGLISGNVDTNAIQTFLAGRSIDDARLYLNSTLELASGTEPAIVVNPKFNENLPLLPVRITLIVQDAQP